MKSDDKSVVLNPLLPSKQAHKLLYPRE